MHKTHAVNDRIRKLDFIVGSSRSGKWIAAVLAPRKAAQDCLDATSSIHYETVSVCCGIDAGRMRIQQAAIVHQMSEKRQEQKVAKGLRALWRWRFQKNREDARINDDPHEKTSTRRPNPNR